MQGRVELPLGSLINFADFCQSIAEAVYPIRESGCEGIDCVIGMTVAVYVPMPMSVGSPLDPYYVNLQSGLVSEDGRTWSRCGGGTDQLERY